MKAPATGAEFGRPVATGVLLAVLFSLVYLGLVGLRQAPSLDTHKLSGLPLVSTVSGAVLSQQSTSGMPDAGQAVFAQYCAVCHMAGQLGAGIAPAPVPSKHHFTKLIRQGHGGTLGYSESLLSNVQLDTLYSYMRGMASKPEEARSNPSSAYQVPPAVTQVLPAVPYIGDSVLLPTTPSQDLLGSQDKSCVRCIGPPLS